MESIDGPRVPSQNERYTEQPADRPTIGLEATVQSQADVQSTNSASATGRRSGTAPPASSRLSPLLKDIAKRYMVVFALLALIIAFSVLKPATFFTSGNLATILTTQAALLVVAVTLAIALAAGEFDLSIAGTIGFCGILVAHLSANLRIPLSVSVLVVLVIGILIGLTNSLFVVYFRVSSFIVTLALGTLLTGAALGISGSSTISNLPEGFAILMQHRFLGVGLPFWYAAVIVALCWFLLEQTPFGRYLFFTGEGREAAALAGVRVNKVRVISLVVSAVGAAFAGIVLVGQTGAADASFGDSYLLEAFAAAFLGAATIKAGRFNILGAVVAVFLLSVGTTGLQLFGLANWVTNVFEGAVLIAAVTFAGLFDRK